MNYIGPLLLQIALIMLNAVFAMAEIAVISMGEAKLSKLQSEGNGKAGKLLKLKSDPAKFPERPQFIFHYRDAFFDRSVAFARKLDAAHECATSANFHFR